MLKMLSTITAGLMVTFLSVSATFAQCDSCSTGDVSFGYPGASCSQCSTGRSGIGHGQHGEVLRAKLDHARAIDAKVSARNRAWPKPFTCVERQAYAAYWRPMVQTGWADQNTLSHFHFDDDGKLTKFGEHQIAGIMKNMPTNQKVVYIQQEGDQEAAQERFDQVQEVVNRWYGSMGRVAFTSRNPLGQNGTRAENITNLYNGAMSPPIIPVADGTSTVGASIGN